MPLISISQHHKLQPMKHPYNGFSSPFFGISKKDLIGLAIIAFISILGLYLSNPLIIKDVNAENGISQPTKHLSAAALNSEKTAKVDSKRTIKAF